MAGSELTLAMLEQLAQDLGPPPKSFRHYKLDGQDYLIEDSVFKQEYLCDFVQEIEPFKTMLPFMAPIVPSIISMIADGAGTGRRHRPLPRGKRRRAVNRVLRANGLTLYGGMKPPYERIKRWT